MTFYQPYNKCSSINADGKVLARNWCRKKSFCFYEQFSVERRKFFKLLLFFWKSNCTFFSRIILSFSYKTQNIGDCQFCAKLFEKGSDEIFEILLSPSKMTLDDVDYWCLACHKSAILLISTTIRPSGGRLG